MNFLRPEHASTKSARIQVEAVISGVPQKAANYVKTEETSSGSNFMSSMANPPKTEGGGLRTAKSNESAPNLSHMGAAPDAFADDGNSGSTPKKEASWPPKDERETARRRQVDTPKTVALKERGLYSPMKKVNECTADLIIEIDQLKEEVRALKKMLEEKDEILAQGRESANAFLQEFLHTTRSG